MRVALACMALGLAGCAATLEDYRGGEPVFSLEDYFSGDIVAWGMVQDYTGRVNRQFCVEIDARWEVRNGMRTGVLDERFYFDDGETSQRVWTLVRAGDGRYTGTAHDVTGEAVGEESGNAFRLRYRLQLPLAGDDGEVSVWEFDVDDWMYRLDERRLFNRSTLSKLGVVVGEITLFFDRDAGADGCATWREAANETVPAGGAGDR